MSAHLLRSLKLVGVFHLLSVVLSQILFSVYPIPNPFPSHAFCVIFWLFNKQNNTATESEFLSSGHLNHCIVAHCKLPVARDYDLPVVLYDTNPFNSTQK